MTQSTPISFSRNILLGTVFSLLLALPIRQFTTQGQGQAGIRLTAEAGFNGYCKEEAWTPVRVSVENTGPNVNGRVQVSYQNNNSDETAYGEDLSLPTTSRKEFFLYFHPKGFIRNLKVSLIANGKTIAKDDLGMSCISKDNMIFGVLSDVPSAYGILNDIQPLSGFVRVASLSLQDLPDRPQGWASLDALIVAGMDTGALTSAQRQSLALWLANGGRLMVVGGPKWQSVSSGLQDFLPIDITSTQTVPSLSELPTYFQITTPLEGEGILTIGHLRTGANVLVEQDGLPILVEKQVGFGRVIYLAADPSLKPLSNWDGMKDVYAYLLGAKPVRPEWMNGAWDTYSANQAVSALAESGVPSSWYICGWLVLYVVVIGPVNFLILRRAKRRDWAWLTTPAIVIVFSGIAYFYGSIYRGQHPILNRIAVVQAWDTSKTAEVRGLVGVYSPRRAKYALEANDQFMLYPFDSGNDGTQSDNWLTLQDGKDTVMPGVRVEIGGMKAVSVQGNLPALALDHSLVIAISDNDPVLRGRITNTSQYTLRDAVLVTSGSWEKVGDLAPGSSSDVEVWLTPNIDGPAFYKLDPMNMLNLNYPNYRENADSIRRQAILRALFYYSISNGNNGNWGIYLMGWLDQPALPVSVQGESFRTVDTTLYIAQLTPSVHYESTTWKLTPGLLAWESSSEGASPYYTSEIPPGGYILRFRPAVPMRFSSVKQLTMDIDVQSYNMPSKISASLWDSENGRWEEVENLNWGLNDIPDPGRYVGPGGEIKLKIDGPPNDYVQITPSTITLVVRP